MDEHVVSRSDFARLIGVNPSQVTGYLDKGKIGPEALVGQGRTARIRVEVAKAHLRVRLDAAQRLGNGLGTRLAPAKGSVPIDAAPAPEVATERPDIAGPASTARPTPPPATDGPDPDDVGDDMLDAELKREKLAALQRANRRGAEEEAAAQGRYTETAAARRQMTMVAVQAVRTYEGAIPEVATALAARFKLDEREVTLFLNEQFRSVRDDASKRALAAAEKLDSLVPDGSGET